MKMAKASEADLAMAMTLANYLDSIERGFMPDALSIDDENSEWINPRNTEQSERLIEGIQELLRQGSIFRVIFGMAVICDPLNRCIDPAADVLEEHPDLIKACNQRDNLLDALKHVVFEFDVVLSSMRDSVESHLLNGGWVDQEADKFSKALHSLHTIIAEVEDSR